jgi:hypothetical protein
MKTTYPHARRTLAWPSLTRRLISTGFRHGRNLAPHVARYSRHQFQLDVPEVRIEIPEPITRVGPHKVRVHVDADSSLELRVDVIPQSGLKQRIADLERRMEADAEKREVAEAASMGSR